MMEVSFVFAMLRKKRTGHLPIPLLFRQNQKKERRDR